MISKSLSGGTDISFLLVSNGFVSISSITIQRTVANSTALPVFLSLILSVGATPVPETHARFG
jgi:hypothetical protein